MEELLKEMKEYIEEKERWDEQEYGNGRKIEEVIESNDMPDIYYKICEALNSI